MSDPGALAPAAGGSGSVAGSTAGPFPTTHWSEIESVQCGDGRARRDALQRLLGRYLLPMQGHVRRRQRLDPEAAEEIVQAFVVNKVLERDLLGCADPARGRFRTFLLTCLDRYASNAARDLRARRGVRLEALPEPAGAALSPDEAFDAEWARQVIHLTITRMREDCHRNGRQDVWRVFEGRVLAAASDADPVSYPRLAAEVGLTSQQAAFNLLATAKRTFLRALRHVVAQYEPDDTSISEEVRALRAALSRDRGGNGAHR